MEKILGVVGGLGPEAGLEFCHHVTRRAAAQSGAAPHIMLDSIAFPRESMIEFARGGEPERGKEALLESVYRLNSAGASVIAIPCNTVHVFMDDLRAASGVPILSIIDETANACKRLGIKKTCLFASSKTLNSRLYHTKFIRGGIEVACPGAAIQAQLENIIIKINCLDGEPQDYDEIANIAIFLANQCHAGGVVLGCTDLSPAAGKIRASGIRVADSLDELEKAAILALIGSQR